MRQGMSTLSFSHGARRHALIVKPARRSRGFVLGCEPLETRQLLSVFQAVSALGGVPASLVGESTLPVTPFGPRGGPTGLSPTQLKTAYGVNPITFNGKVTGNGKGQTIAIIDAYYDPNISSDLARFDAQYGLSAPPSFTQYVESGLFFNNSGWALETALDVEWAHAIAPAASLVLVEAYPYLSDMVGAVSFASGLSGCSV